ncbi:MAG: hypothetical protein J6K52_04810 [Clostridia bacterium]|nr:hypothetical protein [Clostridia bacterium]
MLPFCLTEYQKRGIMKVAEFKESEHPRDRDGKFTDKGKEFTTIKLKPETKEKLKRYFEKIKAKKKLKKQDVHLDKWTEPPPYKQQMANYLGVDEYSANNIVLALERWSDGAYSNIRKAQQNSNKTSPYYKMAQQLEEYIEKAPLWNGEKLYRGVHLAPAQIDAFQVGKKINMKGLSSWSSEEVIAEEFAKNKNENEEAVVFVNNSGTKQGASVTHLAEYPSEAEVLISSKATYKVLNKSTKTNKYTGKTITYIEVEEQ